jgi:hypothetical protein
LYCVSQVPYKTISLSFLLKREYFLFISSLVFLDTSFSIAKKYSPQNQGAITAPSKRVSFSFITLSSKNTFLIHNQ